MKFRTVVFYSLIGLVGSLALFLLFYWSLRLNSNLTLLVRNTIDNPVYFWSYILLTLATIVLFGVNVAFVVHRWRKFGFALRSFSEGGATGGLSSVIGFFASACPICGSTILAFLGVAGGLAAFPFKGLELKALSFGLMALPILFIRKDLKKLNCLPAEASAKAGGDAACPIPKDHTFKKKDLPYLILLTSLVLSLVIVSWGLLRTEPIVFNFLVEEFSNPTRSEFSRQIFNIVLADALPRNTLQASCLAGMP
ncbi:MAG TPA: hypothetical protein VJA63_01610 [Candidatus Paceibacterota bacterium]